MSRLEQMREHFLQKIYNEQRDSLSLSKLSISSAKSTQNIPSLLKRTVPVAPTQNRHPPSRLQSALSVKPNFNDYSSRPRVNITRVKSLCNVSLLASNSPKIKTSSSRVGERRNNSTTLSARPLDSRNVQGSVAQVRVARSSTRVGTSASKTSVTENRRNLNNAKKADLQCKHCNRKFCAQDRLDKHVQICAKTFEKRRPVFNSSKQRQIESSLSNNENQQEADKHPNNPFSLEQSAIQPTKPELSHKEGDESKRETSATEENAPKWKNSRQKLLEAIKQAKLRNKSSEEQQQNMNRDDILIDIDVNVYQCSHCSKKFSPNVISKHEVICGNLPK